MLHLVSVSNFQQEIVERIAAGDDVVLQQGAILAAINGHAGNSKLLQLLAQESRVYVLQDMLAVYGIKPGQMLAGLKVVDYAGLVELTVKNPVILTWC